MFGFGIVDLTSSRLNVVDVAQFAEVEFNGGVVVRSKACRLV